MPVHSVILEAIVWSKLYIFHRHHSDDSERWDRAEAHDEDGGSHTLKIDILTHLCSALVYPSPCHDEHKTSNAHIHLPWPWPLAPFDGCLAWLDAATRVLQPPGGGGVTQPRSPTGPPFRHQPGSKVSGGDRRRWVDSVECDSVWPGNGTRAALRHVL